MEDGGGGGSGEGSTSGSRFPILQANRDPESNWEVDVAKSLEEYLLKICSGEISGSDGAHDVNFAEAALLLQGSVQVYSRKVEYLYSLVLHVLEFLSQNKQDHQENGSAQANENGPATTPNEEHDIFLGLDDVPAEARTTLDSNLDRDGMQRKIVRPPANLLVFEGDSVDNEASELDSYLLATCDFYGDFLLLDPCDAPAVSDFLQGKNADKEDILAHRGSSVKRRPSAFTSPVGRSGGTGRRRTPGKVEEGNPDQTQESNPEHSQETIADQTQDNMCDMDGNVNDWSDHHDFPDITMSQPDDADPGCPDARDDSDDEDPWEPLDPHEPGNLKIKPYRKVKSFSRKIIGAPKKKTLASVFPVAKMDGVVSPELAKSYEVHLSQQEKFDASQSFPLYEKLMRSLESGEEECRVFGDLNDDNEPDIGGNDYYEPDSPHEMDFEVEVPAHPNEGSDAPVGGTQGTQDATDEHGSLEDLCWKHLTDLLASIAEAEQQTELDARVSTWRERIEHALGEQDRNPPFDIGSYGEQILDTLSSRGDNTGIASFTEIVSGKPKFDVARTFSALLQLVNGRSVDLDKGQATNELVCYTAVNPFHVKLIGPNRRPDMGFARKRVKSPVHGEPSMVQEKSRKKQPHKNGKVSVKTAVRLTPEGKRRRKSAQLLQPFNLESSRYKGMAD